MNPLTKFQRQSPKKWTDKSPSTVNKQGELVVGNVLQKNIFHYVENEFLSGKIVKGLETCSLQNLRKKLDPIISITNKFNKDKLSVEQIRVLLMVLLKAQNKRPMKVFTIKQM